MPTVRGVPPSVRDRLFQCQRDAIEVISRYLAAEKTSGSALIRMPMGTGKTGLMALAATYYPNFKNVLLVSPAQYLTKQTAHRIEEKFWKDLKISKPKSLKAIELFTPKTLKIENGPHIYICTIQSLLYLFRNDEDKFKILRSTIDLVLFDEGHREPAREWSKAVRSLGKKSVLFSATPYRNDYRGFEIDPNFRYEFHYKEAEDEQIIRHVKPIEYDPRSGLQSFCRTLVKLQHQLAKENIDFTPKAIIRASSATEIRTIVNTLNHLKTGSAVGFHSTFVKNEGSFYKQVFDTSTASGAITFFVHEHLLLEGIDDSAFQILAVYGHLDNARQLIQQVGRVIRNFDRKREETAILFAPNNRRYIEWWQNYLFAEMEPESWEYYAREFRGSFDPREADFVDHLAFSISAQVFVNPGNHELKDIAAEIGDEMLEEDYEEVNRFSDGQDGLLLVLYQLHRQTSFVKDKMHLQPSLGYFILRKTGSYLFHADSHGHGSEFLSRNYKRVAHPTLQKLFEKQKSRFTYVTLANCDTSRFSVRTRSAQAFSIQDSSNSLNDHMHFCTSIRGYTGQNGDYRRRYVGFSRSRVSEPVRGTIDDFVKWTDTISELLQSRRAAAPLFNRYAKWGERPRNPIPTSILLDLDGVIDDIEDTEGRLAGPLGELCLDIKDEGFTLEIRNRKIDVQIEYNAKRQRFELRAPELHTDYRVKEGDAVRRKKSLLSYLNQEQAFRLTLFDSDKLYAWGAFFEPRWRVRGVSSESEMPMRDCFYVVPQLAFITSEKGTRSVRGHSTWERDSLFGFLNEVTREGTEHFDRLPWLVCDDQRQEICDFLGFNPDLRKVVFVHAKCKPSELSGSFFHDICGQVKKNLDYAHRYSERKPPNIELWDGHWPTGNQVGFDPQDYVSNRILRPRRIDGGEFWEHATELIKSPTASVEVWMLLGQGFRFSRYVEEMKSTTPTAQVVQIAYQLQSTLDAVTQMGAKLKIFCRD